MVDDDVSLTAAGAHAGRRGLAGTVLVHKVAVAAAAAGLPLVRAQWRGGDEDDQGSGNFPRAIRWATSRPSTALPAIARWAAGLGYKGVQIPSWDARLFDLAPGGRER